MSKKATAKMAVWLVRNSGGDGCMEVSYRKPTRKVEGRFTYKGPKDYEGRRADLDRVLRAAGFKLRLGDKRELVLTVKA